ncbi:MAG TPA: magnesium transporter CorA family protein [Nevskiaceae bacterium]|nr:magnesium transporter CorA family protein [Nevskiaceae bacterium]
MRILHLVDGRAPALLPRLEGLPEQGLLWVDYLRSEAECWAAQIEPLVQVEIDAQHVANSLAPQHPSFFDGTGDYDLLIFEGLGPKDDPFPIETRTASFFLFERLLVTVRNEDNLSFELIHQRLDTGRTRCPASAICLTHLILDAMVDRYMKVREPLDRRMTRLQDELLDNHRRVGDWRGLLDGRRQARRLEVLSEDQVEALDAWRRGSRFEWTSAEEVRIRNLTEHAGRVLDHASNIERDVEAAVQLHFASMSHRTNRVVQTLTVMSAIFFPLTLITGIYGMNFEHMPELRWRYGYFYALGLILVVGLALGWFFRRRRLI